MYAKKGEPAPWPCAMCDHLWTSNIPLATKDPDFPVDAWKGNLNSDPMIFWTCLPLIGQSEASCLVCKRYWTCIRSSRLVNQSCNSEKKTWLGNDRVPYHGKSCLLFRSVSSRCVASNPLGSGHQADIANRVLVIMLSWCSSKGWHDENDRDMPSITLASSHWCSHSLQEWATQKGANGCGFALVILGM